MKPESIHPHRCRHKNLLLLGIFLLSCLPINLLGDALSLPPPAWKHRIQPISESDLSGAEPHAQKVIAVQRSEVEKLLQAPETADADLAEAYGRLGAFYQVFGLASAAENSYRNAMQLDPGNFRWVYYAGYQASQSGRHEEAIRLYKIAQALKPDYQALRLRQGESLLELSLFEESVIALQSAAEHPGLRALALYHLAQIDLLQRHYDQAIERLDEVLQLDPKADQAHYPLALAWRAKGQNERSRQHMAKRGKQLPGVADPMLEELDGLDQGARRFFSEGLSASHKQDFAAAANAFAKGLEIEPENQHARVSYARALYLSGESDQAAKELEKVLASEPEHSLALFLSSILLDNKGDLTEAVKRYRLLLKLEPDHYGAHFCLANRLFRDADYKLAASHYHAALMANPDIPPARLYELIALKRSGVADAEIVKRLDALTSSKPEEQILRYLLIRVLVLSEEEKVRDTERARQLANELVKVAFIPPHVELQALVAAAIDNFEQAATLQQQVLPTLLWAGNDFYPQAQEVLAAYQRKQMPKLAWDEETQILRPPTTDVRMLFREYLSAVPY